MHFRAAPMVVLLAATSGCGAETECPAVVGGKAATLKLVVPDGFAAESTGPSEQTPGGQCTWRTSEDRFLSVEVGETESLLDLNDELKEYEDIGGDDEVKDVTYDAPTDAFGELEGERLSWWSYSDGMPADCVQVQANGIRLFWQNPDDIDQRLDDLDIVLDSVELIRS